MEAPHEPHSIARSGRPERRRPGWPSILVTLTALAFALVATNWMFESTPPQYLSKAQLSPQSERNARFATASDSLRTALSRYPGVWPPLYPTVLYLASRCGVPVDRVNQILFYLMLLWIHSLFRRRFIEVPAIAPVLLLALAGYQYANLRQLTAEPLFLLLGLLCYDLLLRHQERGSATQLALLALSCACLFTSRYMGVLWVLPLVALCILAARRPLYTRLVHLALLLALSLAPISGWMAYQQAKTGHLTGMDRFRERTASKALARDEDLSRPGTHAQMALKTLYIDLLSPRNSAYHHHVQSPLPGDPGARAAQGLLGGFLLYWLWITCRQAADLLRKAGSAGALREALASPGLLAAAFFLLYLAGIIAVWSVTNNDPIYTRFLYPCYPFLLLWGFGSHAWLKRRGASLLHRLPFHAAYALLLAVQLHKSLYASLAA